MSSLLAALLWMTCAWGGNPHTGGPLPPDDGGIQRPQVGPRSPQTQIPPLGVTEFLTVFGSAPPASREAVEPQTPAERERWERSLASWRSENRELLAQVNQILPTQDALTDDTRAALDTLKATLERWLERAQREDFGQHIVTPEALSMASDTGRLLVEYAAAYGATATDPSLTPEVRRERAVTAALKAQPENLLFVLDPKDEAALPPHHRLQVERLRELRTALRRSGNLEGFAALIRRDKQPERKPQTARKGKKKG